MNWFFNNFEFIAELTRTHLFISLVPSVIGATLAIIAARLIPQKYAGPVAGLMATIYAIPSLALFVALPAILGTPFIGPTNVLIALTIYFFSSMFFSARDAFSQVPDSALSFSEAQGFNKLQRFALVELPLAMPGLIAGLRVAVASTISMASIGAVVGVRNLGYLFLDGFQRKISEEIVAGLMSIALLALAFDLGLWLLGRAISPWKVSERKNA